MAESSLIDFFREGDSTVKVKVLKSVGLAAFSLCVSTFLIVMILKIHAGPDADELAAKAGGPALPAEAYAHSYEIRQMSMAVMDKAGMRTAYAQFTLVLDCPTDEAKNLMAMNRAKILDSIFEVGSDFFVEDFEKGNAPASFEKMKKSLLERYQKYFGKNAPRDIAFKDWFLG